MNAFEYHSPTKIIFGKGAEKKVGVEIAACGGTRVLVIIGGGSAKRSGLLDRVEHTLSDAGLTYALLEGVQPNPVLSLVHKGIALARSKQCDFILAVGGGSVIDTAKAIALGVPYEGEVWDFFDHRAEPKTMLPVGSILTIPASGSESSKATVITAEWEGGIKKGLNTPLLRPQFAILNPELTYTLPPYQTAAGAVDIMMHTMERYFSKGGGNEISDKIAESVLKDIVESAPTVLREPENYQARSEIMWCGSLSHCELTGLGMPGDWASHQIEHELSTAFHVTHGAGLAAVWGSWARFTLQEGKARFARYGRRVWGLAEQDDESCALAAIAKTEEFFHALAMPVSIPELIGRPVTEDEIHLLAYKCTFFGTRTIGNLIVMHQPEIELVYRMANH